MDEYVGVGASLQAEGIAVGDWIVIRVGIKIISTTEADRVFAQESSLRGIVVSSPVIVEPGFRIKLAGCVAERVG
jgi:hypothetical protein